MLRSKYFVYFIIVSALLLSCSTNKVITLEVSPKEALIDEPVSIRVLNCPDDQQLMLRATVIDDDSVKWISKNVFKPEDGVVDLSNNVPISGSYSSSDAMGFIWSMTPIDTNKSVTFSSKNLSPLIIQLEVYINDSLVVSENISRQRILANVKRTEIRERGLVGTLFFPASSSKTPAVISLTGSGGGMSEIRAALLASHGYASLALAYFGEENLPKALLNIPLDYFDTAIDFLKKHEAIDSGRIGIIGASRGGELSLLLGATYSDLKCVVGYVPSAFRCPGDGGPAWTSNGKPLPFIMSTGDAGVMEEIQRSIASGEAVTFRPMFNSILSDSNAIQGTEIPVENINGDVLVISGEDDQIWPSSDMCEMVIQRLEANDFRHKYKHLSYKDAGHRIGLPFNPTTISEAYHPVSGMLINLGGTPAGNAYACSDSWNQILEFLNNSIGDSE